MRSAQNPSAGTVAFLVALTGGFMLARAGGFLPLPELRPLAAGALCIAIGVFSRRPLTAYLAGLLLAVAWAISEALGSDGLFVRESLSLGLTCGGLITGPLAAFGAFWCDYGCGRTDNYWLQNL